MHHSTFNSKPKCMSLAIAFIIGIFISPQVFSQNAGNTIVSRANNQGDVSIEQYPEDVIVTQIVAKDSIVATHTLDLNENLDVIVQFKTEPVVLRRSKGLDIISIQLDQNRFEKDLPMIRAILQNQSNGKYSIEEPIIKRKFKFSFNGMALRCARRIVEEIKQLPYVQMVYPDVEVRATLTESVNIINANEVWNTLGARGNSILVGVIDTGIDYNHPDLGGGFGLGFKVVDGYDFVNDDADPLDDHGHGTHVAGIVAANGASIKGVAPEASLVAYKVLDASGGGTSSDIIAAIERAVDPDQNPDTEDALDVINLSLGGPGNPDDPMSQAIDNTAAAGVVCVVAAGNNNDYQTIASPGCARHAVTIGATDKTDVIAPFSSRGPTAKIYAIKPDVVAPGVNINSTFLNDSYQSMNGTSMATPHVAGAAALLCELHPTWTPEMIKAALMENTVDIGEDVFTQGSGRIDTYQAADPTTMVLPASISFGLDDMSQNIWGKTAPLQTTNITDIPHAFTVQILETFPTGITTTISPTNFILNAGETQNLDLYLSVDNSVVSFPGDEPYSYEGKVIIQSDAETIAIPFAFIKSPVLEIIFDEAPGFVLIHNRTDQIWRFPNPGTTLSALLPTGTYDIIVYYNDGRTRLIREGVVVDELNIISINKTDASHYIVISPIDENGETVQTGDGVFRLEHSASGIGLVSHGYVSQTYYYSDVSSNYLWEWVLRSREYASKIYQFNGYANGFSDDQTFQNSPEELKHISYRYTTDPSIDEIFLQHWFSDGPEGVPISFGAMITAFSSSLWLDPPLSRPFVQDAYYMPIPYPEFKYKSNFKQVYKYHGPNFNDGDDEIIYQSPYLVVEEDYDVKGYLAFEAEIPVFTVTSEKMEIDLGPPHWFGKFTNLSTEIRIKAALGNLLCFFLSQRGDMTFPLYPNYELYRDDVLIESGVLSSPYGGYAAIPVSAGNYSLKIPFEQYFIAGQPGRATVTATFNTQNFDKNPPFLISLTILSDGEVTDTIDPSTGSNEIQFTLDDDLGLHLVELFYQEELSSSWNLLPLTIEGNLYTAQIPTMMAGGFLKLKIVAEDNAGNNLVYELNPAFESLAEIYISPNYTWVKRAGGTSSDRGHDVATDMLGNIFVTGYFGGTSHFDQLAINSAGSFDAFVTKYNASGDAIWAKDLGGSGFDSGAGTATDGEGNIIVVGTFSETATFDSYTLTSLGSDDIFIAKLDSGGNVLWVKQAGGTEQDGRLGLDVTVDNADDIIVTGCYRGTAFFDSLQLTSTDIWDEIFIAKYDPAGNLIWVTSATGDDQDISKSVTTDSVKNILITGYFQGPLAFDAIDLMSEGYPQRKIADIFTAKYNSAGNAQWAKRAGSSEKDTGQGVTINNDNDIFITGTFQDQADFDDISLTSLDNNDIFIVEYNAFGNAIWAESAGGLLRDEAVSVDTDGSGNLYITGGFDSTCTFDEITLRSTGDLDIFLSQHDATGTALWAKRAGGGLFDFGNSIVIDRFDNIILTGRFKSEAIFDDFTLISDGNDDIFLAKIGERLAPLNITTISLPDGSVNEAYFHRLNCIGGLPPYHWSVVTGALPDGLNLNSVTGAISGTPTSQGFSPFRIKLEDSQMPAHTDLQDLAISVAVTSMKTVPAGDAVPIQFDGTQVTLDFESGPGGDVAVREFHDFAPQIPLGTENNNSLGLNSGIMSIERYWEIISEMPADSFTYILRVDYDIDDFPSELSEDEISILHFDTGSSRYVQIETYRDIQNNIVWTIEPLDHFSFFTLGKIVEPGIMGDVNADELVNSSDALIILSCDVGFNTQQFCPINCGDSNGDGLVNSSDALIILSYDVGFSVPFPVGEPGCPGSVTACPGCNP